MNAHKLRSFQKIVTLEWQTSSFWRDAACAGLLWGTGLGFWVWVWTWWIPALQRSGDEPAHLFVLMVLSGFMAILHAWTVWNGWMTWQEHQTYLRSRPRVWEQEEWEPWVTWKRMVDIETQQQQLLQYITTNSSSLPQGKPRARL